MDLIKQNSQAKIIKYLSIIFIGSIVLAISAKIKIPFLPSTNDNANFCCFVSWFKFWL